MSPKKAFNSLTISKLKYPIINIPLEALAADNNP
jgi:hypothetical protein